VTCFCHNSCCLSYVRSLASSLSFTRTVPQRTGHAVRSTSMNAKLLHSFLVATKQPDLSPVDSVMLQRVYQTKVLDVPRWGQFASVNVRAGYNKALLTMPQISGADVFMPAFGLEENILNTHCDSWTSKNFASFC